MFLLDTLLAPVVLPAKGISYIIRQVAEAADRELNDPARIRRDLLDLQRQVDDGEISAKRFDAAEAILLRRLDALDERNTSVELTHPAARTRRVRQTRQGTGSAPRRIRDLRNPRARKAQP